MDVSREYTKSSTKYHGVCSVEIDTDKELTTVKRAVDVKEMVDYLKKKLKRNVDIVPPKKGGGGGGVAEKKNNGDNADGERRGKGGGGDGGGGGGEGGNQARGGGMGGMLDGPGPWYWYGYGYGFGYENPYVYMVEYGTCATDLQ